VLYRLSYILMDGWFRSNIADSGLPYH